MSKPIETMIRDMQKSIDILLNRINAQDYTNVPPNGPPPPYHGYQPPPGSYPPPHGYQPPGGYAYVPAPVMMPVYPPVHIPPVHIPPVQIPPVPSADTTYVTNNYIYQPPQQSSYPHQYPDQHYQPPPPQQDPIVIGNDDFIDWIPTDSHTAQNYKPRAVVAGHEGWDSSPLWVIRAHHAGDLVPGKLAIKHKAAFIPHNMRELRVHNFEVLCAPPGSTRWLPASNGNVPVGAIPAGNTVSAEPLYIGRVRHMLSLTPGKVHPSHRCCYISFGGGEVSYKSYEVLCKIIG
ncbi:hypothetical protein JYU34_004633 [Plutella xylostella]|uniref:Uncharacterized protein n=1 Tax=Plutella xylostella TaxID=51655 RepID=A0ABQ7QYJ6_PLUXY|nr:hypothetical protein JYU34_004633 [Plutella xylostella]